MASLLERLNGKQSEEDIPDNSQTTVPPEWSEELAQDAAPGTSKLPKPKFKVTTSGQLTPAMKKRVAAELEAYVEFAALPLVMRDEVCGGALHEQAKPIADAIANILARYPDLAHKFLATGILGDWLKLGVVLQPVLKTMWEHHVSPKKEEVDEQPHYADAAFPAYRPGQ